MCRLASPCGRGLNEQQTQNQTVLEMTNSKTNSCTGILYKMQHSIYRTNCLQATDDANSTFLLRSMKHFQLRHHKNSDAVNTTLGTEYKNTFFIHSIYIYIYIYTYIPYVIILQQCCDTVTKCETKQ